MDGKRAEYLMNIARKEQHKAFTKWHNLPARAPEYISEAARLDCSEWATAANELYAIVERHDAQRKEPISHGNKESRHDSA